MLRPQPDAGPVVESETAPLGLFVGHVQPVLPPYAIHPFDMYLPALGAQQRRHPALAITAILFGKLDDRFSERCLVVTDNGLARLCGAGLADHPTSPALRNTELVLDMGHTFTAAGRASYFPSKASLTMSFMEQRN